MRGPVYKMLKPNSSSCSLIVKGQGVFLFRTTDNTAPCIFYVYNTDMSDGYRVELTLDGVSVSRISDGTPYVDAKNNMGLIDTNGAYYWFSLDSQNQTLRLGIGEERVETIVYQFTFFF